MKFGLGDVGSGHLANGETINCLTQLLLKDNDVVFTQIEDGDIAEDVHIRGRAV